MRNALSTFAEILGAAAIVTGVALVYIPAAFVCAGILIIAGSYLAATR